MPRFGQGPVYTGQDNAELLDIPTWDMVQATASETFGSNPTEALQRRDDLGLARKAKDRLDLRLPWLREDPNASRSVTGASASPLLSKSEADAKIDAAGLTGHLKVPEAGEHSAALDMLIDFKTRELRNKFLQDRYKGGIAGGATQLGTALATSLLDPINIGTAFIPIVGEARYSQILGRAGTSMIGRAGARSAVGAVEGVFGAALVEPIVYQSKKDIQADYTTMDSLINVGFGGVFGAALHPAAGAVGDVFARRAKVGAWAESINSAGEREVPDVPDGFMVGGGTRYIDGDDYGRGVFAVADASTLKRPESDGFGAPQVAQLGESPYADSGAPVLKPDGSVANGNKRMVSILDAYSKGEGDVYRQSIVDGAEQYGLDSEAVSGMASPVLVRVEGAREPGRWAQDRALYSQTSAPVASDEPFKVLGQSGRDTEVLARTKDGEFRLTDREAQSGTDFSEFGEVRQVDAFDGEQKIGTLIYANDGTPPTIEVDSAYRRRGVGTAMLKLAREQGGMLGDATGGIRGRGSEYRTGDGQAFRSNADEGSVTFSQTQPVDTMKVPDPFKTMPIWAGDEKLIYTNLPDGTEVVARVLSPMPDAEISTSNVEIVRPDGYGLGTLTFGTAENGGKRVEPKVYVDEASRRRGVATLLYRLAAENGGLIPAIDSVRADRTDAGVAFREGIDRKGIDPSLTREQHQTALKSGVAQAVNGDQVDVIAASKINDTPESIANFLEDRRIAEEAEFGRLDQQEKQTLQEIKDLTRFDPADAAKLNEDVTKLEASLRDEIRATGGDERALDAALAESAELADELKVESQAIKGISMCLLRGG